MCFARILPFAGILHTGSALVGALVWPVSCWELVCQVYPTESLGTAHILLGISQSLVSYWELVHLMGLSSAPLGASVPQVCCWGSVHYMHPAGSQGISWELVHRS